MDPKQSVRMVQLAPFYELLNIISQKDHLRVIDLGCGSGMFTKKLSDNLCYFWVVGIDSSLQMIREARANGGPGLHFEPTSIEEFATKDSTKYNVIFSLAALQLVDNHCTLLPDLIKRIFPGGRLVVQMVAPDVFFENEEVQALTAEIPFTSPVLSKEAYVNILVQNGGKDVNVFAKDYPELLSNTDVFYEYMATTVLSTYLKKLTQEQHEAFKKGYMKVLRKKHGQMPVAFLQKSLFLSARF